MRGANLKNNTDKPSSEPVHLHKLIVSTVVLSLQCSGGFIFNQLLFINAESRQNEKTARSVTEPIERFRFFFIVGNAATILRIFFRYNFHDKLNPLKHGISVAPSSRNLTLRSRILWIISSLVTSTLRKERC